MESQYNCYLIQSSSTDTTYIGYTSDLNRRLRQHNGLLKGGAKATRKHRDWVLRAAVSGFKTKTSAQRFEYYWKHKPAETTGKYRSTRGWAERKARLDELLLLAEWHHVKSNTIAVNTDNGHL